MSTYKEDILRTLNGRTIEAIVIGSWNDPDFDWDWEDEEGRNPETIKEITGKVISWEEAEKWLDYEYDTGYGGTDCHPITIWTKDLVFFCGKYDGSTWITSIPRNPIEFDPYFVGG